MSEPKPGDDIDAYLRQYRQKFTRDAMAAKLIEAGHDPAAVEASIARLEAEHVEAVEWAIHAADAGTSRARRVTRAIVLVVYALVVVWLMSGLGFTGSDFFRFGNLAFIVLAVALGLLVFWVIGRTESIAAMIAWSVVAIVIGLPLALLGACLVGLQMGPA